MTRIAPFAVVSAVLLTGLLAGLPAGPARAEDSCALCFAGEKHGDPGEAPLAIEIEGGLEFSRMALTGSNGGSAAIDAGSGARHTDGGLVDLGGMTMQGRGRITGTPLRPVRIELPRSVTMSAPDGTTAQLLDLATDLPAFATLDSSGTLEFAFGGRLQVSGAHGGVFRGRIPISVDYN